MLAPVGPAAGPPPKPPLYGVTLDRLSGLSNLLAGLSALPRRPTVRVYFNVREPASYYAPALTRVARTGAVMGELLDSSDERRISVSGVRVRTRAYLHALGKSVSIWEIGNEVNGNWTGLPATVARKVTAAYDVVSAAGRPSALTLYENDFGPNHCGDGQGEPTPAQFARTWLPNKIRTGLNYVLLSYYPTQCDGRAPSSATVAAQLETLHGLFPRAALGFGEVGLPHPANRKTKTQARQIMRWAYSLHPSLPHYVGGYFWWYGAQDALRPGAPLKQALRAAFKVESRALAR